MLFSDRLWTLKLGLALVIFSLLCHWAEQDLGEIHPKIEAGALDLPELQGKSVHVGAHTVLAVTMDGFEVESNVGPFHVSSTTPAPQVGDSVSFVGRFAGPRRVVASAVHVEEGYLWKRGLNYGISSLTVLLFLWIVKKRFRWRLSEGLFRSRY